MMGALRPFNVLLPNHGRFRAPDISSCQDRIDRALSSRSQLPIPNPSVRNPEGTPPIDASVRNGSMQLSILPEATGLVQNFRTLLGNAGENKPRTKVAAEERTPCAVNKTFCASRLFATRF